MSAPLPRQKPFRFGVQASGPPGGFAGGADAGDRWRELARRVEGLGYSTLTIADHLDEQWAPVPAMVSAAEATTTLRIGALVLCNDYRHPVIVAKEAASIDVLSGGRLELGLGAGWMLTDYEQAGIAHDSPGTRIERLAEAITVVKGLFADRPLHFEGDHYRIDGLDGAPKPVQMHGPPLLLGGGAKRMLGLAGREADIVALNPSLHAGVIDAKAGPSATADATEEKLRWIADAAGDRYADIEIQTRVHLAALTDDRRALAETVAPALGMPPEHALDTPHALAGTVDEIVEQCLERRERFGISYVSLSLDAYEDFAPVVERLAGT
jgi:probable F420-dependent oxidoreductase